MNRSRSTTRNKPSARESALRLLNQRDYFSAEMSSILTGRGYSEPEIATCLEDLSRWGFLDDARAADNTLESARRRCEGKLAVLARLEKAGAPDEVLREITQILDSEDALGQARTLLNAKQPKDRAAAARLLWRKGYEEETIESLLESWEPPA